MSIMGSPKKQREKNRKSVVLVHVDLCEIGHKGVLPKGWMERGLVVYESTANSTDALVINVGEVTPKVYAALPNKSRPGELDVREWCIFFKQTLLNIPEVLQRIRHSAAAGNMKPDRDAWSDPLLQELGTCIGKLQDFGSKLLGVAGVCDVEAKAVMDVVARPLLVTDRLAAAASNIADQIAVKFGAHLRSSQHMEVLFKEKTVRRRRMRAGPPRVPRRLRRQRVWVAAGFWLVLGLITLLFALKQWQLFEEKWSNKSLGWQTTTTQRAVLQYATVPNDELAFIAAGERLDDQLLALFIVILLHYACLWQRITWTPRVPLCRPRQRYIWLGIASCVLATTAAFFSWSNETNRDLWGCLLNKSDVPAIHRIQVVEGVIALVGIVLAYATIPFLLETATRFYHRRPAVAWCFVVPIVYGTAFTVFMIVVVGQFCTYSDPFGTNTFVILTPSAQVGVLVLGFIVWYLPFLIWLGLQTTFDYGCKLWKDMPETGFSAVYQFISGFFGGGSGKEESDQKK